MITYTTDDGELRIIDRDWLNDTERSVLLLGQSRQTARRLRRLMDNLAEQEAGLQAITTPTQAAITWGDYYSYAFTGNDLMDPAVVYGQVLPLFDIIAAEQAAGAGVAEIDQLVARIREGYDRGWRHVRAWSRREPRGETGDTHVGVMIPLTAAEFAAARAAGWPE